MKVTKFFILPIKGYQYFSKMFPANCRYYPTCSEYGKWQFEFNRTDKALAQTTLRILRCNQLFPGGIDYPIVDYTPPSRIQLNQNTMIKYWIVPKSADNYYILKDFTYKGNNKSC